MEAYCMNDLLPENWTPFLGGRPNSKHLLSHTCIIGYLTTWKPTINTKEEIWIDE